MSPDALVVAHLLVAAVLLTSGLAKVARPADQRAAFASMDVPAPLRRPLVIRCHPWFEILLGIALVSLPHPADAAPATLALLLLTAYLVLVWRVVARGGQATCRCFGSLGASRVGPRTVLRNALLVALAAVSAADAWGEGSVPRRLADLDGEEWWWLAAAAVTAALAVLVLERTGGPTGSSTSGYLRLPVPDVPVRHPHGVEQSLRELATGRAQLLLFLSPGCGPCVTVARRLPSYAERLPDVDVRVVSGLAAEYVDQHAPEWLPFLLFETDQEVSDVLGITGRPVAVLLGRDRLLAAGPVRGPEAIDALVDDVAAGRIVLSSVSAPARR